MRLSQTEVSKMTKKQEGKKGRTRYSAEFKQQALLRAQRDGVVVAARDLGLQGAQLYAWRGQQQGADVRSRRRRGSSATWRGWRRRWPF